VLFAGCGTGGHADRPVIGVVQVSSVASLDDAREGFYKALADSGYVRDVTVTFLERNAQGDIPTLSLIMREFLQQGVTQVATISSVATQTAMKVITDRPIVFGAVSNPYVINAGTSPTAHRPNVTGAEIPFRWIPRWPSPRRRSRRPSSGARSSTRPIPSPSTTSAW
jgi:putative ABC transport system substrate-binding protein